MYKHNYPIDYSKFVGRMAHSNCLARTYRGRGKGNNCRYKKTAVTVDPPDYFKVLYTKRVRNGKGFMELARILRADGKRCWIWVGHIHPVL